MPTALFALLLASAPPCPPGTTLQPAKIDDLFAPDPGCEVEARPKPVSRRVIYHGRIESAGSVTVDVTQLSGSIAGFARYDSRDRLVGLSGTADAAGNVVLTELASSDGVGLTRVYDAIPADRTRPTGRIVGRITEQSIEGTWKSQDGKTRHHAALAVVAVSDKLARGKDVLVTFPVFLPRARHARLNALMRAHAQAEVSGVTCADCSYERSFYLEILRDGLVSIMLKSRERGVDGRATTSHRCVTIRLRAGEVEPLALGNLLAPGASTKLAELVAEQLRAQGASHLKSAAGTKRFVSTWSRDMAERESFAVTPAGLKLLIDAGAVGAPADGPFVVLLPHETIRGMLRPDAASLVGGH